MTCHARHISTVIRWSDDTTTPVVITPCNDGSGEWRVVKQRKHIANHDRPRKYQRILMRCEVCDREALRMYVGHCSVCGGWMLAVDTTPLTERKAERRLKEEQHGN